MLNAKNLRLLAGIVVSAYGVVSSVDHAQGVHLPVAVSAVLTAVGPAILLLQHYLADPSTGTPAPAQVAAEHVAVRDALHPLMTIGGSGAVPAPPGQYPQIPSPAPAPAPAPAPPPPPPPPAPAPAPAPAPVAPTGPVAPPPPAQ